MKDIKKEIISLSKEFDDKEGYVSCEISVHKDKLIEVEKFIAENINVKRGKWIAMKCDSCEDYNGKGYIHVSIERFDVVAEIESASNYIKTLS